MMGYFDHVAAHGFIDPDVEEEFPGLRLDWMALDAQIRESPAELKRRLRDLASRYRGASVVAMRTQPIPHAYRSFFRQVGLDPDVTRIPSERAAVARLVQGTFRSENLIDDALLVGLIETGVPIWALDADLVADDGLGIRLTVDGDRLGTTEYGSHLPAGTLAVVDARCVHALLFGEIAPGHGISHRTTRVVLFSVGVEGVPVIHVEEALWMCTEVLRSG
jgi:DNA/RNA-binding domain of Phe-tRNA-synthetase-like protein